MQRKMLCSLIVLAVTAGALAAAEGKHSILLDRSYPGMVVKVDDAKHTLVIYYKGPDGKRMEKPLLFSSTVKLNDIKPGIRYRFFEQGGKVIAVQPIPVSPSLKNPPSVTGIAPAVPTQFTNVPHKPVVKEANSTVPPKPSPLTAALAAARKADQEKFAATEVVKFKTAAAQAAVAKTRSLKQYVAQVEKSKMAAAETLKTREAQARKTANWFARANAAATRADAVARLEADKAALAQIEAARAAAAAKVAHSQVALAKLDCTFAEQAKTMTAKFLKARTAAFQAVQTQYFQAKAFAGKAFQQLQTAQQIEKQKTTAAQQAAARVNYLRTQEKARAQIESKNLKKAIH